jgi:hypothetical protein
MHVQTKTVRKQRMQESRINHSMYAGMNFEEIGKQFGISKMGANLVFNKALLKIAHACFPHKFPKFSVKNAQEWIPVNRELLHSTMLPLIEDYFYNWETIFDLNEQKQNDADI